MSAHPSTGLMLFEALCVAGHSVEQARESLPPAGDAWCALTDLLQGIDSLVDALVTGALAWAGGP